MENIKLPACPVTVQWSEGKIGHDHQNGNETSQTYGFTKLEKAALMITQGMLSAGVGSNIIMGDQSYSLDVAAVAIAKAVLEEANK